jgi:site-specific DNA-methyltransferase (adenine-specific)
MADLVALFTNPGELIADAFMGSGTTGVAALQAGRRFVGIEKNPAHFDVACRRIREAHAQRTLFAQETPAKPEQLGLESA